MGAVDVESAEIQTVRYESTDSAGNNHIVERKVHVYPTLPVLTINGKSEEEILYYSSANFLTDLSNGVFNASAIDALGALYTTESGSINVAAVEFMNAQDDSGLIADGTYNLRYRVEDPAGNVTEDVREIVIDNTKPEIDISVNPVIIGNANKSEYFDANDSNKFSMLHQLSVLPMRTYQM